MFPKRFLLFRDGKALSGVSCETRLIIERGKRNGGKNMKKLLAILLCLALVVGCFAGCGQSAGSGSEKKEKGQSQPGA